MQFSDTPLICLKTLKSRTHLMQSVTLQSNFPLCASHPSSCSSYSVNIFTNDTTLDFPTAFQYPSDSWGYTCFDTLRFRDHLSQISDTTLSLCATFPLISNSWFHMLYHARVSWFPLRSVPLHPILKQRFSSTLSPLAPRFDSWGYTCFDTLRFRDHLSQMSDTTLSLCATFPLISNSWFHMLRHVQVLRSSPWWHTFIDDATLELCAMFHPRLITTHKRSPFVTSFTPHPTPPLLVRGISH